MVPAAQKWLFYGRYRVLIQFNRYLVQHVEGWIIAYLYRASHPEKRYSHLNIQQTAHFRFPMILFGDILFRCCNHLFMFLGNMAIEEDIQEI